MKAHTTYCLDTPAAYYEVEAEITLRFEGPETVVIEGITMAVEGEELRDLTPEEIQAFREAHPTLDADIIEKMYDDALPTE